MSKQSLPDTIRELIQNLHLFAQYLRPNREPNPFLGRNARRLRGYMTTRDAENQPIRLLSREAIDMLAATRGPEYARELQTRLTALSVATDEYDRVSLAEPGVLTVQIRYHAVTDKVWIILGYLEALVADADDKHDALVSLDQASAMVEKSKRTLERYRAKGKLPEPDLYGGGGKAHQWYWSNLRPALEKYFRPDLPDKFPASRII